MLSAPLGNVAIAFMNIMGAPTLLAWNKPVARIALDIVRHEALLAMKRNGGFMVSGPHGLEGRQPAKT